MEAIAYRALAHMEYPTSAECNAICQALVTKYPPVKETEVLPYSSEFWKETAKDIIVTLIHSVT